MAAEMNLIPEMTDPLCKYWQQPRTIRSAPMDDTHVLLTRREFKDLHEYSSTIPSGVYNGKCWKRDDPNGWMLCWYGDHPTEPKHCSINFRKILIGD